GSGAGMGGVGVGLVLVGHRGTVVGIICDTVNVGVRKREVSPVRVVKFSDREVAVGAGIVSHTGCDDIPRSVNSDRARFLDTGPPTLEFPLPGLVAVVPANFTTRKSSND